jgi:3-hydroxybutyryl-CoA dehydratase
MSLADEMHGYYLEDLSVGMTAVFGKTITEADIQTFAGVSGDTNPLHLHDEFAKTTMFKGRIAHGMLSASFISTVVGTKLPGPGAVYVSQTLNFRAPVRVGDCVTARATVREIVADKRRVIFDTVCSVGDKVVLDGEATILVFNRRK